MTCSEKNRPMGSMGARTLKVRSVWRAGRGRAAYRARRKEGKENRGVEGAERGEGLEAECVDAGDCDADGDCDGEKDADSGAGDEDESALASSWERTRSLRGFSCIFYQCP